jgi:hypothetical protein
MNKSLKVFIGSSGLGVIGIYLGAMLNLEGYLGSVFAIAAVGAFIVSEIDSKKDE